MYTNIMYIGKFALPHNTENYVRWALEKHGVRVHPYQYNQLPAGDKIGALATELGIDGVLFAKHAPPNVQVFVQYCRASGIPTACWCWDLYWGLRSDRPAQWWADHLFTTDGGNDANWSSLRVNHHLLRQGIHKPEHVLYLPRPTPGMEVVFVGSDVGHYTRKLLIKWLQANYTNRFKWVQDARGLALNRTLAKAKVVVGDSYPSPHYWSNRIYEILGRGGFLLHPRTLGLSSEFTEGQHYVEYDRNSFRDLKEKIDYYLAKDKQREEIRQKGWDHVGAHYTYTHRVQELLATIRK